MTPAQQQLPGVVVVHRSEANNMADRTVRAQRRAQHHFTAPPDPHPLDQFIGRIEVMGECWVIDGKRDEYAQLYHKGRHEVATRYIWRQTHDLGSLRRGVHIHHTCECPGCVNPNHLVALEAGDHRRVHAGTVKLEDVMLQPAEARGAR